MPSWLAQRAQARRDIHAAFGCSCTYEDSTIATPVALTVRWHAKPERVGNIAGGDYSEILSTLEHLVFDAEELAAKGITLKHGGLVKLLEFDYQFNLDVQEPPDGPVKQEWTVVHP